MPSVTWTHPPTSIVILDFWIFFSLHNPLDIQKGLQELVDTVDTVVEESSSSSSWTWNDSEEMEIDLGFNFPLCPVSFARKCHAVSSASICPPGFLFLSLFIGLWGNITWKSTSTKLYRTKTDGKADACSTKWLHTRTNILVLVVG